MIFRILFCFFIAVSVSCDTNKQRLVPDSNIYECLKHFLLTKEPPSLYGIKVILDQEIDTDRLDPKYYEGELLAEADKQFMNRQQKFSGEFKIKQEYFPNQIVIPFELGKRWKKDQHFFDTLEAKYGVKEFATFSLPLFSADTLKALVRINTYNTYHNSGGIYLMVKDNGKWKVVDQISHWP